MVPLVSPETAPPLLLPFTSPGASLLCRQEPWREAAAGGGVTNLTHSDAGEGGKAVNNLREVSQCPEKAPTTTVVPSPCWKRLQALLD